MAVRLRATTPCPSAAVPTPAAAAPQLIRFDGPTVAQPGHFGWQAQCPTGDARDGRSLHAIG
jgi:hypothetical protein